MAGVFDKIKCCLLFCLSIFHQLFRAYIYISWVQGLEARYRTKRYSNDSIGKYHTQAMAAWKDYEKRVATGESIGCQLDRMGSKVISDKRKYVKAVMECILHCALQGIALHGHDESDDSLNPGNLKSLMTLLSRHSPEVNQRLQNCSKKLHDAKYITVLADESKDISKHEQLSIAFRYVLHGKTMERFVGYTLATDLTAQSLAKYIMAKMDDLKVNPEHLVSQCYDGASVMSGSNAGVHKFIKERSPQAVYIHCCAHRLNLVLVDVAKRNRAASDFFSHLQALYNALGGREIHLKKRSDTRWSCHIDSITAILSTYSAVIKTLEDVSNGNDRDRAIEAVGILNRIFSVSANLFNVLQLKSIDISAASCLIQSTIDTFNGLRSDEYWGLIWEEIQAFVKQHKISPPRHNHRQRHPP
uniref:DUF4371 domain-containing protein n=1 Tax=Amphimedon queenslandica TaxID=400682 RepID=A0A1X7TXN3_AMPQE